MYFSNWPQGHHFEQRQRACNIILIAKAPKTTVLSRHLEIKGKIEHLLYRIDSNMSTTHPYQDEMAKGTEQAQCSFQNKFQEE